MPVESPDSVPLDDAETEAQADQETDGLSALQKVEALLKPPAPEAEQAAEPGEKPPAAEKLTVQALAEKLKADPAAIYALEVPLADGETVTLGQLKDAYRSAEAQTKERQALTDDRARYDVDRRQSQEELAVLLRLLPQNAITPQLLSQAQQTLTENKAREGELLLKAIPEWKDPVRVAADRAEIETYVAGFGFTKHDLAGVTDHRLLRLVRTAALREAELRGLKADKPKPVPKVAMAARGVKTSTPAQEHGRLKAAVTTRRMQPVDAVSQLLRGR